MLEHDLFCSEGWKKKCQGGLTKDLMQSGIGACQHSCYWIPSNAVDASSVKNWDIIPEELRAGDIYVLRE